MRVGKRRQLLDIHHVQLRVAQRLSVDGARILSDRRRNPVEVVRVHKLHLDAQPRQRVVEEVVRAAIERSRGHYLVTGRGQRRRDQRLRSLAGGCGQPGHSTLQRRHALLKHVGGGVHDAGVDVAELLQRKEPPRVIRVLEGIRGGLVDRHGARSRGWVGRLAGVNGKSGKVLLRFGHRDLLRVLAFDCCRIWVPHPSRIRGPHGQVFVRGVAMRRVGIEYTTKQNGPNPLRTRAA